MEQSLDGINKNLVEETSPISEVVMRFPIPEQLQEARIALQYQAQNILLWEIRQIIFELLDNGYSRDIRICFEERGNELSKEEVLERLLNYINEEIEDNGIMLLS